MAVDLRHRELSLVAASAVSVVAVVAVVGLVGNPWRGTSASSPVASQVAASSASPLASPATSLAAVSVSEPASAAALASAPIATSAPLMAPSAAPPASGRTSPPARVAEDSQPNLKVNVEVSPTQVVWGHPVRVTVTVADAGGVFNRPVVMFVQGTDPPDTVSDVVAPCTSTGASISCPITNIRPGHKWSFTFTFIPGPFPGKDGFDDPVGGAFNYDDSHGQEQESEPFYSDLALFDPPASSAPASGAPSDTPLPSGPAPSAAPPLASSAPPLASSAPPSAG